MQKNQEWEKEIARKSTTEEKEESSWHWKRNYKEVNNKERKFAKLIQKEISRKNIWKKEDSIEESC